MMNDEKLLDKSAVICVVGLGYTGIPLAVSFAMKGYKIIGYDISTEKISSLKLGIDPTKEVGNEELKKASDNIVFTNDPLLIREADFILITVPTPLTKTKDPDLSYLENAAITVGRNMKKDSIVVLESSVYPGTTEEFLIPILEKESKMKAGMDFKVAYSSERINVGDNLHKLHNVVKVVSGLDEETTETVAKLYGLIVEAGIFKSKNIKTAETSKLLENIQRDLNIALMNEMVILCEKMGISIWDVIDTGKTKWNFLDFVPGLVGGYCVPVNPYYLTYKAEELGYSPQLILAGRRVNDYMPIYIADLTVKTLAREGKKLKGANILLLGLGFKKNVGDVRTTQTKYMIDELKKFVMNVIGYDPLVNKEDAERIFGIKMITSFKDTNDVDVTLLITDHDIFKEIRLDDLKKVMNGGGIIIDTKRFFNQKEVEKSNIIYKTF